MARPSRYTQLVFGSTALANQMLEFGSLFNGTPVFYSGSTITPSIVQTLANYLTGWYAAVVGANSPTIQEMNSLFFLVTYQLAYMMVNGIPEYDSGTTYYTGCVCSSGTAIYQSLTDNNVGNALTSLTNWQFLRGNTAGKNANYNIAITDNFITANAISADLTFILPLIASCPAGTEFIIKKIDSSGNTVTIVPNSGDAEPGIDNHSSYVLSTSYQYVRLRTEASGVNSFWCIVGQGAGAP